MFFTNAGGKGVTAVHSLQESAERRPALSSQQKPGVPHVHEGYRYGDVGQCEPVLDEVFPAGKLPLQVVQRLRQCVVDGVSGFVQIRFTAGHPGQHHRPEDLRADDRRELGVCALLKP